MIYKQQVSIVNKLLLLLRLLDFAVTSRQCRLASATTSNDRNLRPFLPLLYVSRILKFPIQHAYVSLHNLQEACFDDLLRQLLCGLNPYSKMGKN
ncbi:hypothetical protein T02_5530 [Trichinella nativa]|uniref:Secreted protein n=1 Tax=Trichinella nativa TaxID=6335 RepID=A0A0V1L902_9BILA|nr:hypothetical protein T02_5530 [Trichinella nativa]